ncbi:MAG TPA: class I SAM-dependent methyltransferase [Opitutales bacterium]|nr:class I SAM-dependent methyltransferase [Opitutales bacterium]
MNVESVKAYFESDKVVEDYAEAAAQLGLWVSEEKIFTRLFRPEDSILELGCGVGRIAIALHELGYHNVLAVDYSRPMIQRTRALAKLLEYAIPTQVADATELNFEDAVFDGAIFGFNGLMQIPGEARRMQALREIHRVLRAGAWFAFTTHDRERSAHRDFWRAERKRWDEGKQSPDLETFGDRAEQTGDGLHFMHVPSVSEMEARLQEAGFRLEVTVMRSELCEEPAEVKAFSDDCRFWVVQKPRGQG